MAAGPAQPVQSGIARQVHPRHPRIHWGRQQSLAPNSFACHLPQTPLHALQGLLACAWQSISVYSLASSRHANGRNRATHSTAARATKQRAAQQNQTEQVELFGKARPEERGSKGR